MDVLLEAITKSIMHLKKLDEVFSSEKYPEESEYKSVKENIRRVCTEGEIRFADEFYVGGKEKPRRPKYSRVMILSDIVTYIVSGRGYFYAVRSEENMSRFLKLILFLINQLMLFDSMTTNVKLRKKFLQAMEETFDETDLFKQELMKKEHKALKAYNGPIGFPIKEFNPGRTVFEELGEQTSEEDKCQELLENYYDSLLPKALGLWGELLTYAYLLRQKVGYVLPLLLTQQLISGIPRKKLAVPDILIIPFNIQNERMFGVEIGIGKETQSTEFFALTGITPTTKANADNPKRCTLCGKWMLFCPVVIERYSNLSCRIDNFKSSIKCLKDCNVYRAEEILGGKCPYAMHRGGNPQNVIMKMGSSRRAGETYHFHLRCLLRDPTGKNNIAKSKIMTYYPFVSGLEKVEKLVENKDLIIKELKKSLKEKERMIEELETSRQLTF